MSSSAAGVLAVAPFAIVVARWFRSRGPTHVDRARARARVAALAFREATERPSTDLADAFAEFASACLACPVRTVIGPDLSTRLSNAGVARVHASRAAELFDDMIASRYERRASEELVEHARTLVDELASEFRDGGAARADQE